MNNLFSDNLKQVLHLARNEAVRTGNNYIGTEHILLGIIRQGDCSATKLLKSIDLDLAELEKSIEDFIIPTRQSTTNDKIPFTARSKQILAYSANEAKALEQKPVSTAHLLLALAKDTDGIAGLMLAKVDASYAVLKEKWEQVYV